MIELGRVQELMVVREKNFGVYLGQKKDDGGPASEKTSAGGHKSGR